jgi:SAM-dependent methyltransferase
MRGVIDLFSEKSDLYALARPRYPEELFDFIASRSPACARAWDCGAGNGQAAVSLAAKFAEVCASDVSREQIAHAIATPNVRYSVQPAERTDYPARHFDAICVAQALHWFDFAPFFHEVVRVARPGALFAAWGYGWPEISPEFDGTFKTALRDVIEPWWAPQNRLLLDAYADVPFPFPRVQVPPLQIVVQWTLPQFMAYIRTWSATRRCEAEKGDEFLASAAAAVSAAWGDPDVARIISMSLVTLAGRIP